jgi:DNA invertase Pin-like site-specific DNA recombinase
MNREQHQKVTPHHLKRAALLYVRQSTMCQVFENTESTQRQYPLRDRAVALGWPRNDIVVVDGDLGHEERVLVALRDKLMRRDLFEDFCNEYVRELNRLRMEH